MCVPVCYHPCVCEVVRVVSIYVCVRVSGVCVCLCPSEHLRSGRESQHVCASNCLDWVCVCQFVSIRAFAECKQASKYTCVRVSVWSGCVPVCVRLCMSEVVGVVNTYMYMSECLERVCACQFVVIHASVRW